MGDVNRWVTRLSWALVILTIISAIAQLGLTLGLFVPSPNLPQGTDLVERLAAYRGTDQQVFSFVAIGSLATVGVYLVAGLLGLALRSFTARGNGRDIMVGLFVLGAAVGIVSQVVNLSVAHSATLGYCDCGYKTEELIAQDYALSIGWALAMDLSVAAVALVGVAVAMAGRLVAASSAWRTLSYVIAALLLVSVVVRLIAMFVFVSAFDPFAVTDLILALTVGILVPIWAVMLALAMRRGPVVPEAAA